MRRRKERQANRQIWFADLEGGLCEVQGSLLRPDAHALDKRLTALAATVCQHDPRTSEQRRADALGGLAAGADRLACCCGRPDGPGFPAEDGAEAQPGRGVGRRLGRRPALNHIAEP